MAKYLADIKVSFSDKKVSAKVEPTDIYIFHLEEGLSRPFSGYAKIHTVKPINIDAMDLTKTSITVDFSILNKEKNTVFTDEKREVNALIKSIKYLGKQSVNQNTNEVLNDYLVELESPLALLKNKKSHFIFHKKTIIEIIQECCSTKKDKKDIVPLTLDVSELEKHDWLKESKLSFQQGADSDFDFLNRLLFAYGINYVQVHTSDGIKLSFSLDQNYPGIEQLIACSTDPASIDVDEKTVLLEKYQYGKNYVDEKQTQELIDNFSSEFFNPDSSGEDRTAIFAKHLLEIKHSIKRRYDRKNSVFSADIQRTKLFAGCTYDQIDPSFGAQGKYLVEKSVLHLCSLVNEVHPVTNHLEGLLLPNGKSELLGSFVPKELLLLSPVGGNSNVELHKAIVCDENGEISRQAVVPNLDDDSSENDVFYAKLLNGNLIFVHALMQRDAKKIMIPVIGDRILVMRVGFTYYFYGYLNNPISTKYSDTDIRRINSVSSVLASSRDPYEIDGFGDELNTGYKGNFAFNFNRFKNDKDYVLSLLMQGATHIGTMAYAKSVKTGNAKYYDSLYLDNYKSKVDEACNNYKNSKKNLSEALSKFRTAYEQLSIDSVDPENSSFEKKVADLKAEQKIVPYEQAYQDSQTALAKLADDIVKDFSIDDVSEGDMSSNVSLSADDAVTLDANGDLLISANNINITATGNININATKNIRQSAGENISQTVGASSISLKVDGTTIYAPAAYSGFKVEQGDKKDTYGKNAADLLSSTFAVKGYSGITGKAFNVSFNANNNLSVTSSLGCGIQMGYGSVNTVGAEINIKTIGRIETATEIVKFLTKLGADIATSCAASHGRANTLKNNIINTVFTAYDDVFKGIKLGGLGFKAASKKVTKPERYFTYVQTVISWINYVLDCVYHVCKQVYVYMDWDQKRKEDQGKSTKEKRNEYITSFDNSAMNKLDQVRMYIDYFKVANSIVVAGFNAFFERASLNPFDPTTLSSIKVTPGTMKMEGDEFSIVSKKENMLMSPAAAVTDAKLREMNHTAEKKWNAVTDSEGAANAVANAEYEQFLKDNPTTAALVNMFGGE